ncbi:MAG: hypothetical protein J5641_04100 [Bacteroidales bacterium]|nr:hypothetical protein [Bacteroidales bacterium]
MSNQTKYNSFRKTYPEFVYESYRYDVQADGLHIVFTFRIGENCFQPTAFIPARPFLNMEQPSEVMDTLVFNIGMIELVSYWKCFCPPVVKVVCGRLDDRQVAFWKKIYFLGLGEFFYTNGIAATMEDFMTIAAESGAGSRTFETVRGTGYLIPIGGGKDSVVTLEALKEKGVRPLIMNPRGATKGCAEAAGFTLDDCLVIKRNIHPRLLDLNAEGCLNGHTPFSAMLAFYTLLAAQLSGISNIALSNEASANEATVVGTDVNHQYSKSIDFENDFRHYVAHYISPTFNYFSFLRPLSELQIAMLFSRNEKYFDVFRSCNAGSKQDVWCGRCAKCLFAYIILSPFIPPARLDAIFGRCLLDDEEMKPLFDQLVGRAECKPFECVGTIDEVNTALGMTRERWYGSHMPALLREWLAHHVGETTQAAPRCSTSPTSLTVINPHSNLSDEELSILTRYVQAAAV